MPHPARRVHPLAASFVVLLLLWQSVLLPVLDQVERSYDRSNRSSFTVYDGLNRAVGSRMYGANGALVTYPGSTNAVETLSVYDGAERAIAMRDERGHWSRTVYDDAARTTRSEDEVTALNGSKQLLTSTTVLDDDGRTAYTLDPQGTRTEWRYDDAGRVLETHLDVRYNSQTGARTIYARSQTSYDVLGRATKETNPSQQWKSYDYDSLGRLRAVMQPQDDNASRNLITRFGYDEAGLKLWQQDAKGYEQDGRPALTAAPQARVTRFAYDVAGRSIARQMPELVDNKYLIERTGYDELGRVDSHTDFRGFTTKMSYDVRGRMLSKVPDSRLNEKGLYMGYPDEFTTVASRGNGAGALVTTSISDSQRGWLRSVESPTGTLTYGYDVGGNRTSVTHTRGSESFTTNYGYDELSRLTKVSDGDDELARIGYDLKGNREQVLRANGVATGYQFDSLNRLKKLTHAKGNVVLSSFDYAVRQDGKRTGVTENIVNDQTAATPRTSSRDVGFTYDDAGRLTKEEGGDGLGVSYENAWQYDAAGNRAVTTYKRATKEAPNTVATTATIAAVFTGNDWLKEQTSTVRTAAATNATTTFYGYDRNGAQTQEKTGAAGAVEVNDWQFDGTLASTQTQGQATGGSEFVYDASGNRLKQKTKIGTPDAKEVRYLVDPNTSYAQVVQERDENNVLQARYAWEDGLAPLVMWRRTQNGAYAAFFYLCDGQDSVRQLTDASGRVTDSYFYDAFGNAQTGGSGDTPNSFRYTGQQLDASGDYYLRARYYNAGSGRFLSHDPLMGSGSDPISMHRYLYASADGANFTDPSGEESLANVMVSIGVRTQLANVLTTVYHAGVGLSTALSAYNLTSDYLSTGVVDPIDTAFLLADLALPSASKVLGRFVKSGIAAAGKTAASHQVLGWVLGKGRYFAQKLEATAMAHIFQGSLPAKLKNGVSGAHDLSEFAQVVAGNYKIVGAKTHSTVAGIIELEYKTVASTGPKTLTKTVFDPSVISRTDFLDFMSEARSNMKQIRGSVPRTSAEQAQFLSPGSVYWEGVAKNGLRIGGYENAAGKIISAFPLLD